jgi:hypothetical protein
MEDDLKIKNGRRPKKIKWNTNKSTKNNLIGCETILNYPSFLFSSYGFTVVSECKLYGNGVPLVNHHFLQITPDHSVCHFFRNRSGQGLKASWLFNHVKFGGGLFRTWIARHSLLNPLRVKVEH